MKPRQSMSRRLPLCGLAKVCQPVNPSPYGGLWSSQSPIIVRVAAETGISPTWVVYLVARGYIDPEDTASIDRAREVWERYPLNRGAKRGSVVDLAAMFGEGVLIPVEGEEPAFPA